MTAATSPLRIDTLRLVDPALRDAIDRLDGPTRFACGYHLGFWDASGRPNNSRGHRGKAIRATLALLSAAAAGAPPAAGIPAAVACELVHNFSLLHDDVIDRDTERRHRPTVWARFGLPDAILSGDALLALAYEVLAEAPSPHVAAAVRKISTTVRRLIAGQAADVSFEKRDDVTLTECLTMASNKTGALLACSASIGALLAGAPASVCSGLSEYGDHLGMAFQLTDDLLGIWGDPARTGKPVLSDLRARKKSLPVVVALNSTHEAGKKLRELYAKPGPLDEDELALAARLVEEAGGRTWTEAEADRHLADSLEVLRTLKLHPEVHSELVAVAHQLRGRDH